MLFGVLLAGLGRISARHLAAMEMLPQNFKLLAVCDVDEVKAKSYSVPWFSNFESMLDAYASIAESTLVVICTPSGLHAEMVYRAAAKKYRVLVEKPAGFDADYLAEVPNSDNVYAVLQLRQAASVQNLRDSVLLLGDLIFVQLVVSGYRESDYYLTWHGDAKLEGNILFNQGIHYIDILQWVLGSEPKYVRGVSGRSARRLDFAETIAATIKFHSGVLATIAITTAGSPHYEETSIAVFGTKGHIKLSGDKFNKIETWQLEGFKPSDFLGSQQEQVIDRKIADHCLVYQAILDGTCPKLSEAIPSIRLIQLISDSVAIKA